MCCFLGLANNNNNNIIINICKQHPGAGSQALKVAKVNPRKIFKAPLLMIQHSTTGYHMLNSDYSFIAPNVSRMR